MKKTFRTIFAALAASALCLALCACGGGSDNSASSAPASTGSTASVEAPASDAEGSAASTEAPASGNLTQALEKVKAEVKFPAETNDYTAKRIKRTFGLEESQMEEFAGLYCIDGVTQDQIIYIKAKTADDVEAIRAALQANWESVYNVIKSYTPEQAAIIEKATVDVNGNYVSLVISGSADQIKTIFNDYLK